MIESMIEATKIILNYGLDSSYYTKRDYNLIVEWKDQVQNYLNTTVEDIITARIQFERFEDALVYMVYELEYDEEYE